MTTFPCVCSIDPGAKGAIAFLTESGELLDVLDMPSVIVRVNRKDRVRVAEQALALLIAANRPLHAFVELSGPMPTDGSQAAYGMGLAAGLVRGVLAGLGIPITLIPPVVWKRGMGLTADKGMCRQRAMQLYPARANLFARVKDDGRSDSLLLGVYGLRTWQRDAAG